MGLDASHFLPKSLFWDIGRRQLGLNLQPTQLSVQRLNLREVTTQPSLSACRRLRICRRGRNLNAPMLLLTHHSLLMGLVDVRRYDVFLLHVALPCFFPNAIVPLCFITEACASHFFYSQAQGGYRFRFDVFNGPESICESRQFVVKSLLVEFFARLYGNTYLKFA